MNNQRFNSISKLFAWLLFVVFILSACTAQNAKETETKTPRPTKTKAVTITPIKPTNTFEPTATVDLAATANTNATATVVVSLGIINIELQKYGFSTNQGNLGYKQPEKVTSTLTSYLEKKYIPLSAGKTFSDFIIYTEITWDSTSGLAVCGLTFRAAADFNQGEQYNLEFLRLSGLPAWGVEFWNYGKYEYTASGKRLTNSAIDQKAGSTNRYLVIVQDKSFTSYVNDKKLGIANITRRSNGEIAFFAYHESGTTTCTYDNTWVWALK